MPDYKMTKEQKSYLESLVCQRISRAEANRQVIEAFNNPESSPGITNALKNGWNVDKQDKVAFYIIKDPADNQPLLFFSLKCGELHQPLDRAKLDQTLRNSLMLLKAAHSRCGYLHGALFRQLFTSYFYCINALSRVESKEEIVVEDWAEEVIEKQLVDDQLPEKFWHTIVQRIYKNQDKLNRYIIDEKLENGNIIRTKKTFAAVELVHFCAHAPAQEKWKTMNMGQSLGRTMFWHFIEPKIRELRDLVGCEYFYLFAADDDRTGGLCNLYKELGFDFQDKIYVTKPYYDFCCYFMCQEVRKLRTRKNEFLRNYNKPKKTSKETAAV